MKFRNLFCILILVAFLASTAFGGSLVKPKPAPKPAKKYSKVELPHKIAKSRGAAGEKEWTLLYYLDADNDLEPFMLNDVDEMEMIGSTDNVNLVAMVDRSPNYDPRDGDWTNSKLYFVTRDSADEKISSKLLEDFQEMDMADPQTLARFVAMGMSNFPAKKYALILGDHGGSWPAMLNDESNNEHGINMGNLLNALQSLKDSGSPALDLMVFDMCLMSQLEVMDVIQPFAKYAVASEELEPGEGYPNHKVLYSITKNPAMGPKEYAESMVQAWADSYNEAGQQVVTSAAIDLTKIPDLVNAVSELGEAMAQASPEVLAAIGRARDSTHFFGGEAGELNSFDLGNFVSLLAEQPEASGLKPQCDAVMQALNAAVIKHEDGNAFPNATGLSIYLPLDGQVKEGYQELPFARTQWDEFLTSKGGAAESMEAGIVLDGVSDDQVYDLGDDNWTVRGKVTGTVSSVQKSFGYVDKDSGEIVILSNEEVLPPNTKKNPDGSYVPRWKDGDTFETSHDPEVQGITDGKDHVIAPLYPVSPGSRYKTATSSYHSKFGDKTSQAVFNETGLESMLCLSEGNKRNPMALKPVKGDDIVLFQVTNKKGGDRSFRPSKALEVNDQVKLQNTPLPEGEYVMVLTAYGADGQPAASDQVRVKTSGEGAEEGFDYPDYGYDSVDEDDLDYINMPEIVGEEDYNDTEGDWDDYAYMEELEADDFDSDDLEYLDDVALDEDEMSFDDDEFYDYDAGEDLTADDQEQDEDADDDSSDDDDQVQSDDQDQDDSDMQADDDASGDEDMDADDSDDSDMQADDDASGDEDMDADDSDDSDMQADDDSDDAESDDDSDDDEPPFTRASLSITNILVARN